MRFAETSNDAWQKGNAVSILGIFRDESLVPIFQKWLHHAAEEFLRANGLVHSLAIALDNLNEEIIEGSSSLADPSENIRKARKYLNRTLGVTIPW